MKTMFIAAVIEFMMPSAVTLVCVRLICSLVLRLNIWLRSLCWSDRASELVKLALGNCLACTVEGCTKLDKESSDVKVTVDVASILERKGILHIKITLNLSPKIYVLTDYVSLDIGALADDNTALAYYLAFEKTINADIVWRNDLTLDDGSGRNSADSVHIH